MAHITAVAVIFSIYLCMGFAFYGWGRIAFRLLGSDSQIHNNSVMSIWLGWAFTLAVFQILHLFLPITAYVSVTVFLIGILCSISPIRRKLQGIPEDRSTLVVLCFAFILVFYIAVMVASKAMLPPSNYDSGLYHFNAIRWINSYPIVPGLGNLHGRLAFNSSFFTYVSAVNFYPFFGYGRSVANSFLVLLVLVTIVSSISVIVRHPRLLEKEHVLRFTTDILIFPVVIYLSFSSNGVSSPSPDLTSTLLQLTMFILLAHGIAEWINGQRDQDYRAISLTIIAASAVTIKLSNLAFSGVIICFALIYSWQISRSRSSNFLRIFLLPAIIIVVWGIRGIILSGAPLYPSTVGYIHFDWAVPLEKIREEANWVYSWARSEGAHPKDVLGNWGWVYPWFLDHSRLKKLHEMFYPLIVTFVFGSLTLSIALIKKDKRRNFLEWAIMLPSIAGLVFWFFTAPDPRLANATFYLVPISTILLFLISIQKIIGARMFLAAIFIVIAVNNILIAYSVLSKNNYKYYSTSGFQPVKVVPLEKKTTLSGLSVYTPQTGDQCWDSNIPSTPYFNSNLVLRNPKEISSGFRVTMEADANNNSPQ